MNLGRPCLRGPAGHRVDTTARDSFDQLEGRTIGTVDGYNYNAALQELFGSNVKIYPSPTAMYADVKSGRVDAACGLLRFGSPRQRAELATSSRSRWSKARSACPGHAPSQARPASPSPSRMTACCNAINDDIETLRTNGMLEKILVEHGLDASAADPGALRLLG